MSGREENAEAVLANLREMLEGSHTVGMLPDRLKGPLLDVDGKSHLATALTPDLMTRVARSLADPRHVEPDANGKMRPANVVERLKKAGCTIEMYYEMAETREFIALYGRVCTQILVLPLVPQTMAAQMAKAGAGDDKAARIVFELTRLMDRSTVEDARREYSQLEEEAFWKRLREEAIATLEMVDEATTGIPANTRTKCLLCLRPNEAKLPAALAEAQAEAPRPEPHDANGLLA